MSKPTEAQIAKLPVWAQEHIKNLEGAHFMVTRELTAWKDHNTKQPISVMEILCSNPTGPPETIIRYVSGRRVTASWGGIELNIHLMDESRGGRTGKCIEVSYSSENRHIEDCALVPKAFQTLEIKTIKA